MKHLLLLLIFLTACGPSKEELEAQLNKAEARNTIYTIPRSNTRVPWNDGYMQTIIHDSCMWVVYNNQYSGQFVHSPNCNNHSKTQSNDKQRDKQRTRELH